MTAWIQNDGGRAVAGFKGSAGDCVVRAIAIALELPYQIVYDSLKLANEQHASTRRTRIAKRLAARGATPRDGNFDEVYRPWLAARGWKFVPTMAIGSGCKVHLRQDELPTGRIIASVSKHLCAVVDGTIHDTHDPSRSGTRCVYGYYVRIKETR